MRRRRVLAYVTRERDGRKELLVFDQDTPGSGTQVPAGRLDPGETLEQCLLRELHEEAGIEQAEIARELGTWNTRYENHAFEVHTSGEEPADTWEHVVLGDGDDAGLVFRYRWEPVTPDLLLFERSDPMLELL